MAPDQSAPPPAASDHLGRPPLFSPAKAREILNIRKQFDGVRLTTAQFIDQLVEAGDLETHCSVVSMRRLLNGTMYPSLKAVDENGNKTGELYDYSKVPSCYRGRPPHEERVCRDTGAILPVFTKRQKVWQEHVLRLADRSGAEAGLAAARKENEYFREQLGIMARDVESLRNEIRMLRESQK